MGPMYGSVFLQNLKGLNRELNQTEKASLSILDFTSHFKYRLVDVCLLFSLISAHN